MTDDEHGCPNCDPEHAPKTEAAQAWLEDDCWGRGHYHPYVEHDFHETAAMLIKVEHEAAAAECERLRKQVKMAPFRHWGSICTDDSQNIYWLDRDTVLALLADAHEALSDD